MTLNTPTTTLRMHDLMALRADLAALDPERFAADFYDLLFTTAPSVRSMFADDLTVQRRKLMTELGTLIELATSLAGDDVERAGERARRLGTRHHGYGAGADHYEVVGAVLLTTLARHVEGWDEASYRRWEGLYALVASIMHSAPGASDEVA